MEIRAIWSGVADLGESCMWHPTQQYLYWVDILNKDLYCYHPDTDKVERWAVNDHIGCIAPIANSHDLVAAMGSDICKVLLPSGKTQRLISATDFADKERLNDGKCDSKGRFWYGTITRNMQSADGGLYCYDGNSVRRVIDGVYIGNGLDWSPDNKTFYHTDSKRRSIFAYDFDAETGELGKQNLFMDTSSIDKEAVPDGLTTDADGNLWVAMWNGWSVVKLSPEGKLLQKIDMPVQRPTCVTFGGEDLSTLYVTSASKDFGETDRLPGAMAGAVFAIETDSKGLLANCYR